MPAQAAQDDEHSVPTKELSICEIEAANASLPVRPEVFLAPIQRKESRVSAGRAFALKVRRACIYMY